ncbi:MAG: hypothetical protein WD688_16450 [Candidatus Binatia bacterium]
MPTIKSFIVLLATLLLLPMSIYGQERKLIDGAKKESHWIT